MLLVTEDVKAVARRCFPESRQSFARVGEVEDQTKSEALVSVLLLSAVSTLQTEERPRGSVQARCQSESGGIDKENEECGPGKFVRDGRDGEQLTDEGVAPSRAERTDGDTRQGGHKSPGVSSEKEDKEEPQVGPQTGTPCTELGQRRNDPVPSATSRGVVAQSVRTSAGLSAAPFDPTRLVEGTTDVKVEREKDGFGTLDTFPDCNDVQVVDDLISRLAEPGMASLLAACDDLSLRVFDQKCLEVTSKKKKWVLRVLAHSPPASATPLCLASPRTSSSLSPAAKQTRRATESAVPTSCPGGPLPSVEASSLSVACCADSCGLNEKAGGSRGKGALSIPPCDQAAIQVSSPCSEPESKAEVKRETEEGAGRRREVQMQLEGQSQVSAPRCLGFIVYRVDYELQSMQIGKVAVLEACRGRGYGKKLVRGLIRTAKQNKALAYVSLSALTSAVSFYTPLGFKRCDEISVDADEDSAPQVYMEMQLRRRAGTSTGSQVKKNARRKK